MKTLEVGEWHHGCGGESTSRKCGTADVDLAIIIKEQVRSFGNRALRRYNPHTFHSTSMARLV
jgi:hypothetical protein